MNSEPAWSMQLVMFVGCFSGVGLRFGLERWLKTPAGRLALGISLAVEWGVGVSIGVAEVTLKHSPFIDGATGLLMGLVMSAWMFRQTRGSRPPPRVRSGVVRVTLHWIGVCIAMEVGSQVTKWVLR